MRDRKDHEGTCAIGYSQTTYIRYVLIYTIHYGICFNVMDVWSRNLLVTAVLSTYQKAPYS